MLRCHQYTYAPPARVTSLFESRATPASEATAGSAGGKRLTYPQVLTLVGLITLGVGALVFELNVELVAITIAVGLTIAFPKDQARAVEQIHSAR